MYSLVLFTHGMSMLMQKTKQALPEKSCCEKWLPQQPMKLSDELNVKAEIDNVSVFHDIFFPFQTNQPFVTRRRHCAADL